jgi:membrane associated rhomboid family serine protease
MHPNDRIMLLIPPIPMKAKYFVIIFGALELLLGILGGRGILSDNVAHFAHLGGMLFGWLLLMSWKRRGKIYY